MELATMGSSKRTYGPVRPGANEKGLNSRPLALDEVKLNENAYLGGWQKKNAAKTIPHLIQNLINTGAVSNLETINTPEFKFKGMWFSDSDVHKALEALCWSLFISDEPAQREFLANATAAILHAQESDGYVNTYFQGVKPEHKWLDFYSGHEMYTAGHLIQAAVAESRVLGGVESPLMQIATKFADLLVEKFGGANAVKMCGHPEIETALFELYRETQNKSYFDLAEKMILSRGHNTIKDGKDPMFETIPSYIQDHLLVKQATKAVGHSVRQLYLNAAVMDLYMITGDQELLVAQEKQWEDMIYTKMYVTGGLGSRHKDEAFGDSYELPNDRAYAETCASIANFMWSWRLLLATGKGRYAEVMELSLYNILASSVSSDVCKFFYSNPLQYRKNHFVAFDTDASERLPWYRCSCCPPNIGRIVASFQHYVASTKSDSVLIHLYADSHINTVLENGSHVGLKITTNYPHDGKVSIASESAGNYSLKLRIPEWANEYSLKVKGSGLVEEGPENRYLIINGTWAHGDTIELDLKMSAEFLHPHPNIDASRGCVVLRKGPVIYAIEQADVAGNEQDLEDFHVDTYLSITSTHMEMSGYGSIPALVVQGRFETPQLSTPYPYQTILSSVRTETMSLTAIPYALWGNRLKGAMRVWIPTVNS
jgi:DUF1680 family protein